MITDPKEVKRVAASSSKSDPKAFAQAFYELLMLDLRQEIKAIRTPVLLIGSTALLAGERGASSLLALRSGSGSSAAGADPFSSSRESDWSAVVTLTFVSA